MELSDKAEEMLESLWIETEEEKRTARLNIPRDDGVVTELLRSTFITLAGDNVTLTEKGRKEAEACIRRHRLGERLMADVIEVKKGLIDELSCKFR